MIEGFIGSEARQDGLRIRYTGHLGDINIVGGLESDEEGYSAMMPFWMAPMADHADSSTTTKQPVTLSHVGIMVGAPDPMMSFPTDMRFRPYLALRNTTAKPIELQLTLYPENGTASKPQIERLRPNESKQVNMAQILKKAGLADFSGNLTLTTSHTGQLTDVLEAAGSVDDSGTYVFEVEGKAVEQSLSKQTPYWSTANGNDTMVSLWNGSAQAEDILVTLSFQGGSGQYQLPFHLEPYGSASFNIGQLIMEQRPDAKGHGIPAGTKEGSLTYASAQGITKPMTLNVNAGVFNVQTATCFYGCVSCDGYSGPLIVIPNPLYCPLGDSHQMGAEATYDDGNTYGVGASWSSENTNIASITTGGLMTGSNPGSTNLDASAVLPTPGSYCAYNPNCGQKPESTLMGQGPTTVATLVVQNDGNTVPANGTVYITADPAMPNLSAYISGDDPNDTITWSLTISYSAPDNSSYSDTFPSGGSTTTTGSNPWNIANSWQGNFRGGTATLNWTWQGSTQQFTFNIQGSNPSASSIDADLSSRNPAWFFPYMVSWESQYQQFSDGLPLFGAPHGFGLTQVDPPGSAQDIWNWKGNITAGLGQLSGKQARAYSFADRQIQQWLDYNSANPDNQVAGPADDPEGGPCLFTYPVRSGTQDFKDADWIKATMGLQLIILSGRIMIPIHQLHIGKSCLGTTITCITCAMLLRGK